MLRIRHAARLGRDVIALAAVNRAWWVVPAVLILVLVALTVVATQVALPYSVYTLF